MYRGHYPVFESHQVCRRLIYEFSNKQPMRLVKGRQLTLLTILYCNRSPHPDYLTAGR